MDRDINRSDSLVVVFQDSDQFRSRRVGHVVDFDICLLGDGEGFTVLGERMGVDW